MGGKRGDDVAAWPRRWGADSHCVAARVLGCAAARCWVVLVCDFISGSLPSVVDSCLADEGAGQQFSKGRYRKKAPEGNSHEVCRA